MEKGAREKGKNGPKKSGQKQYLGGLYNWRIGQREPVDWQEGGGLGGGETTRDVL